MAEDISAVVAAEAVEGTPVEAGAEEEVVVSIQAEGEVVVELAEVVEVAAAIIDCGKRLRKRRVVRGILRGVCNENCYGFDKQLVSGGRGNGDAHIFQFGARTSFFFGARIALDDFTKLLHAGIFLA